MGWGKGKGKAVERALHRAEREEEWAAERALARGDLAGAMAHAQKAESLEHAEHELHRNRKGKGKGYHHHPAADVVVVAAAPPGPVVAVMPTEAVVISAPVMPAPASAVTAERALHREEVRQERMAGAALAKGNVVGALIHAEKAQDLERAERAIHHEVVHARAHRAHHAERREEHLAARDLARGDIIGAISHEVKATEAHQRGNRLEAELHHHRDHHHHGWSKGKGKGKGWW